MAYEIHLLEPAEQFLYELRVRQGSNIVRLFYFFGSEEIIVVTSGYRKKSDRTDRREIERALRLKDRYLHGGTV